MRHFFALLRYSLGGELEACLTDGSINWRSVYEEAKKQSLLGITYLGVERLSKLDTTPPGQWTIETIAKQKQENAEPTTSLKPPLTLLLDWMGEAKRIKRQNNILNQRIAELSDIIRKEGFEGVLLKGQGVAMMYPSPQSRTPGDIDLWIKGNRNDIISFIRKNSDGKYVVYHNANFPIFEDISVEIHFTPSWFWNPIHNLRLQKFFRQHKEESLSNRVTLSYSSTDGQESTTDVSIPTQEFNEVFILQHIYRHLFGEGIGLRQVLDYYYVLKNKKRQASATDIQTLQTINSLGMKRFAKAMMWILKEQFGLEDKYLICETSEKDGRFLLDEIIRGGDFGHYDDRNKHKAGESAIRRFWVHVQRDFRFLRYYPSEVLCVPFWKIWHFFWRKQYINE